MWIFDYEVHTHDWLVVFKKYHQDRWVIFHNDSEGLREFLAENPFCGGYNNKHYDNHIQKAAVMGMSPEDIKGINDLIIVGEISGWDIPVLRDYRAFFSTFDIKDDSQDGTSLKGFEAHMGCNIVESSVDWSYEGHLSQEQLDEQIQYCKTDVLNTELMFDIRLGYYQNKVALGQSCGIDPKRAMNMTNATLTARYLGAEPIPNVGQDERNYQYPDKLLRQYIPQEVFDFFDKIHDLSIPNDVVFKGKLEIMVGDCPTTLAYGGIHGAIPHYVEEATEDRVIRNKDVASYYPHLMILPLMRGQKYGYTSRAIKDPRTYVGARDDRIHAKRTGDKAKNLALKLVLNTTYGCMGAGRSERQPDGSYKYYPRNDLYDPLMARSVCISGQLLLLELAEHLLADCPTLKVIQLNTDGIMVSMDKSDEEVYQSITQEWQTRTWFELEEDFIQKIVQKDVNNYIEIPAGGGKPKCKGGQLVRGVLTNSNVDFQKLGFPAWENLNGGAFNINNNAVAIANAVKKYFIDGTDPKESIYAETEILMFQIISKVGSKYSGCYQLNGSEKLPVQKVNRVYASSDWRHGTLYKTHAATGADAKVGGLPSFCLIDNDNHLRLEEIDRDWYVREAWRTINNFLGRKAPRKNNRVINGLLKQVEKELEEST